MRFLPTILYVVIALFFHPDQAFAVCATCDSLPQIAKSCPGYTNLCCSDANDVCPSSSSTSGPFGNLGSPVRFRDEAPNFINVLNLKLALTSINGFVNALIPLLMTFAGLILFIMLLAGGFQMLTSATDPKAADAGKQRITTALIGFLIIFASYWIVQILEIVLGVKILGN